MGAPKVMVARPALQVRVEYLVIQETQGVLAIQEQMVQVVVEVIED